MEKIENRIIKSIQKTPLFEGIGADEIEAILSDPRVSFATCKKDEVIFQPEKYKRCLVFLIQGTACITSTSYQMRTLSSGSFFGVAALFNSEHYYVSRITALSDVSLLYFEESLVEQCIRTIPQFAMNYIRFLGERIHFLNGKISLLGSSSSKDSLIQYLLRLEEPLLTGYKLPFSYATLARNLNISRASLYRTFSELEEKRIIKRDGKTVTLLDPQRLKEYQD